MTFREFLEAAATVAASPEWYVDWSVDPKRVRADYDGPGLVIAFEHFSTREAGVESRYVSSRDAYYILRPQRVLTPTREYALREMLALAVPERLDEPAGQWVSRNVLAGIADLARRLPVASEVVGP